MNGRYKHNNYLLLKFDLAAGRELGIAYRAIHALNALGIQGEIGVQLKQIHEALKYDIITLQEAYIKSANYNICIRCAMEIDLRLHSHTVDENGNMSHKICPILKPSNLREL